MATEDDHLARLRDSLQAVQARPGDVPAIQQAVEVLLAVGIAHHESVGLVPQATPAFMEAGEPIAAPATDGETR